MAEISTFIKIDRNIVEWRWYKDVNTLAVFLYLILRANIKDHDFENITVHRGELVASYSSIAENVGLTPKQVRTAIEHLKKTEEVAVRLYPKYQVISIKNYDKYQGEGSQAAGKGQQSKNDKNEKNGRNILADKPPTQNCKAFTPPTVEEVRVYCSERNNGIDAEYFVDYYTANGWTQGKNGKPIKDWKAAVRTWERNASKRQSQNQTTEGGVAVGTDSRIYEGFI